MTSRLADIQRRSLSAVTLGEIQAGRNSSWARFKLGEIQAGIELTRSQDAAKAVEIQAWLELVAGTYNVLPMDGEAFRCWGRLMHRRTESLYEDAMIAATASVHALTAVTRNVADFALFDMPLLNPFKFQSAGWLLGQ